MRHRSRHLSQLPACGSRRQSWGRMMSDELTGCRCRLVASKVQRASNDFQSVTTCMGRVGVCQQGSCSALRRLCTLRLFPFSALYCIARTDGMSSCGRDRVGALSSRRDALSVLSSRLSRYAAAIPHSQSFLHPPTMNTSGRQWLREVLGALLKVEHSFLGCSLAFIPFSNGA